MRRIVPVTLTLLALGTACQPRRNEPAHVGELSVEHGARLYYRVVGRGADTAIVLHGGPGLSSRYLYDAFDPLATRHTIIYYDQRGRGHSDAVRDSTLLTAAQDVADLDSLRRFFKLSRVTLLGHHWGAVLGALYAKRFPEHVRRLVFVSPSFPRSDFIYWAAHLPTDTRATQAYGAALVAGADTLDPRAFCDKYWGFLFSPRAVTSPALVHRLAEAMCDAPPQILRQSWFVNRIVPSSLHGLNLADTLRAVVAPALIVQGAADSAMTEAARTWAKWTPGARDTVLAAPGWFPWLEDRVRFQAVVQSFIEGTS
jgi:proline iminopeptidase